MSKERRYKSENSVEVEEAPREEDVLLEYRVLQRQRFLQKIENDAKKEQRIMEEKDEEIAKRLQVRILKSLDYNNNNWIMR